MPAILCVALPLPATPKGVAKWAGPIGPKFGTHLQIHLGMDIRQANCPSRYKGNFGGGGGVRGHKFKTLGKLSNNWTDWHQIWYTSADSSRNGHMLNTIRPSISHGAFWFFLGGHKFKSMLKLSNGWNDWHQI